MNNKQIIEKIKGLLKLANDNRSDEEGQSAFALAQRLMLKHKISQLDINDGTQEKESITTQEVTNLKRLYWWEKILSQVIAKNFRVMYYLDTERGIQGKQSKSRLVFYGEAEDVELAKEMYLLAYEALLHHTKNYLKTAELFGQRKSDLKKSYIKGFLIGLARKFEEQSDEYQGKYELLSRIPKHVEESYEQYSSTFKNSRVNTPRVTSSSAFNKGVVQGNKMDLTKSTIGN